MGKSAKRAGLLHAPQISINRPQSYLEEIVDSRVETLSMSWLRNIKTRGVTYETALHESIRHGLEHYPHYLTPREFSKDFATKKEVSSKDLSNYLRAFENENTFKEEMYLRGVLKSVNTAYDQKVPWKKPEGVEKPKQGMGSSEGQRQPATGWQQSTMGQAGYSEQRKPARSHLGYSEKQGQPATGLRHTRTSDNSLRGAIWHAQRTDDSLNHSSSRRWESQSEKIQ